MCVYVITGEAPTGISDRLDAKIGSLREGKDRDLRRYGGKRFLAESIHKAVNRVLYWRLGGRIRQLTLTILCVFYSTSFHLLEFLVVTRSLISPALAESLTIAFPASRNELIEINGERVKGISGESVAQKLRGHLGTSVTVKVHNSDLPGKKLAIDSSFREVKLPYKFIRLSPISSVIIPRRTPNVHVSKTGYVNLLAFSQTASTDMKHVIPELENQGVKSHILDLRNNPRWFGEDWT
ncbi:unnamed protein product [Lactuca virosa]|uniref:Tail specific protease domain-containing protein n=1 Tax=Lactuca virosa TaxID=75947 RepID=A0AAU9N4W0_9ASTR|nr:unnamed protein product [Lactuca virosa]